MKNTLKNNCNHTLKQTHRERERERERGCETKPSNEKQEIAFFFFFLPCRMRKERKDKTGGKLVIFHL
jgi:hypothetical protein